MDFALYFDNAEGDITRETSHPYFVAYAIADFYYSAGDDFAPFGSDTGNDTLRFLEEWYQERRAGERAATFLRTMLKDWGFGMEYILVVEQSQLENIDWHDTFFTTVDQAVIAIAFGQHKIAGKADKAMINLATAAFQRQRYLAEKARTRQPKPWDKAAEYLGRLDIMEADLSAMANKKAR